MPGGREKREKTRTLLAKPVYFIKRVRSPVHASAHAWEGLWVQKMVLYACDVHSFWLCTYIHLGLVYISIKIRNFARSTICKLLHTISAKYDPQLARLCILYVSIGIVFSNVKLDIYISLIWKMQHQFRAQFVTWVHRILKSRRVTSLM